MTPSTVALTGEAQVAPSATLVDFWQWAFSDFCDDDIKGIFAEWMVRILLGLPTTPTRRVSWADSDIILAAGTRIEVKATSVWQSWKLVNEDGSRKPTPSPRHVEPARMRFAGLCARTAVSVPGSEEQARFKSDFYVFCFQRETDPAAWDAWNLDQWEFYVMSRQELVELKVRNSISLATLRRVRAPMSAAQFQAFADSWLRGRFG